MEEVDAMEGRKNACRDVARLILSIVIMLLVIWVVHTGYRLATEAREHGSRGSEYNYVALMFGVATVVFGSIYFIVGLTIVAELALDLSTWFQTTNMGIANDDQEKEHKTICQLIIQTSVTMGSILMLSWAIYHGSNLVMDTPQGGMYCGLAFLIGFTAMGFGFIYFILGIGIMAESTVYLSCWLKHLMESDICQDQDAGGHNAV